MAATSAPSRLLRRASLAGIASALLVVGGALSALAADPGTGSGTGGSGTGTGPIPTKTSLTCTPNQVYTSNPVTPCTAVATAADGTTWPVPVTYTDNVNAGDPSLGQYAHAQATFTDPSGTYDTSFATQQFTIAKAPSQVRLTCPHVVAYTGAALEPCQATVTVLGGSSDQAITYTNNIGPGEAKASTFFYGDSNVFSSGATVNFLIGQATTVTVTCTPGAVYTGSALEPCSAVATAADGFTAAVPVTYADNTNAGTATASASYAGDGSGGHLASPAVSTTFTIAKAPSTVTVTCPASVDFTGASLTPCTASTTGPGILSGTTSVTYTDNVYAGTATATGTYSGDLNHLGGTGSATFQIRGFSFRGYYSPVAMGGGTTPVWNTVKAGSTVPLKYEAFLPNGTEITSTAVLGATFTVTPAACPAGVAAATVTQTSTGATGLRYDTTSGQFVQNWKTPKATGCYRVTTTTADHSTLSAYFILR